MASAAAPGSVGPASAAAAETSPQPKAGSESSFGGHTEGGASLVSLEAATSRALAQPNQLGVVGSSGAVGSGGVPPHNFRCVKCLRTLSLSVLSSSKKSTCMADAASYKALTDRWQKNR